MQKKSYQPLTIPKIEWDRSRSSDYFGELVVQPLEPGYGITLGNALRRIMLSSVEGAAVTSVVIDGVNNEFASLTGVVEDVLQLVLNIKGIVVKNSTGETGTMKLSMSGESVVTAKSITADSHLEILNPDHVIAHLAEDGKLDIEFTVETGRGYRPAQWDPAVTLQQDGRIYVDAMLSPVKRVEFHIEKTRVGENIDHDRLFLSITTNGAMHPKDIVHYAASLLRSQFEHFLGAAEIPFNQISAEVDEKEKEESAPSGKGPTEGLPVDLFLKSIDELEFSVRAHNCLVGAGIKTVLDLVNLTEEEVLKIKNFGSKSLREVKEILSAFGLRFGMNIKELDLKKAIKDREEEE
ncbi:DNA-directed RNA polymerase subunit alpha [bacterium]|nr:DNA-directed RNA polymerase subunit alpha [bacterium]